MNLTFEILMYIQICSGIMHARVLSGELYAQRLQKLFNCISRLFHEDFFSVVTFVITTVCYSIGHKVHSILMKCDYYRV